MNLDAAAEYIRARLQTGQLSHRQLAMFVVEYQRTKGLEPDGKPGPKTLQMLGGSIVHAEAEALRRFYPLPCLPDLRRPYVTSGFKENNPSRPNHDGCDLFYRWTLSDGPQVIGDGGATRDPDDPNRPRWFIPSGTCAIAAAAGRVQSVANSPTGWRIWVEHADGFRTGYFHLADTRVVDGQTVSAGHPLGLVGHNPRDKDARHLHFEVSPVGRYDPRDPEAWLESASYFIVK